MTTPVTLCPLQQGNNCTHGLFFGYPITNATKHLVMMDSGEIWGVTNGHVLGALACLFDDISPSFCEPKW